jgi:NADH:ubiquinone oxidoreductase subunit K
MFLVFTVVEWGVGAMLLGAGALLGRRRSLLHLVLYAEIAWVGLYVFMVLLGTVADSAALAMWALLLLCLATAESAVGLSLVLVRFTLYGAGRTLEDAQAQQRRGARCALHLLND